MHGRPVGNTGARQSKIELVAAVRMVARGCACERGLARGSACGGGFQPLDMALGLFKRLFRGVEPARTLLKVPTPGTFFSLLLAKPRLGAV